MRDNRRVTILYLSAILVMFAVATTGGWANPQANVDYRVLSGGPPSPAPGTKTEIAEVFWYGCPFCQEFEPILESWVGQHSGRVVLSFIPAAVNPDLLPGAKTYYTLKDLGLLSKLHDRFFDAARSGEVDTTDPASIFRWFASRGVNQATFEKTYQSRRVRAQVEHARRQELGYEIVSIPTIIVNGRFLTSTRMAGGYHSVLRIVAYLLNRSH